MDRTRFDDLTRLMASGHNRRTVLRGLLGGVAVTAGVRQVAVAQDDSCVAPGERCEMEEGAVPCCESPCYSCFEGTCDYGGGRGTVDVGCVCETNEDCYAGKCVEAECACLDPGDECEMVEDHGCCGCYTCFEGICDNAQGCWDEGCGCETSDECCDVLLCLDGVCGTDDKDVALPETGSGSADNSGAWVAAAVAGGAAVVAAKALKRQSCGAKTE